MDNFSVLFDTNINLSDLDPMDPLAVWPHGIECCIGRIPIRKRDGYSVEYLKKFPKN